MDTPERDRLAQSLGDGSTDSQPREAAGSIGKHIAQSQRRAPARLRFQVSRHATRRQHRDLLGNDGSGKTERNRGTISGRINRQPH
jgi:hypothetical protein